MTLGCARNIQVPATGRRGGCKSLPGVVRDASSPGSHFSLSVESPMGRWSSAELAVREMEFRQREPKSGHVEAGDAILLGPH